jgi:SAM-dependent methyltransferase
MPSHDDSVQTRITGFWSTIAPGYEAHPGNVPARDSSEYDAWVEAIRELLPPAPADVLDIATGTGFVALIAAGLGHRVTGIDLSAEMLDRARADAARRGLEVRFLSEDAVEPKLAPASFDAIISRHFIWTLREPQRAFRNWRRLLRPNGRVVAIDGFWFKPEAGDEETEDTEEAPELFQQHYTPETQEALPAMQLSTLEPIKAMLKVAGFGQIRVSSLSSVHALAENPPSSEPWYVIVASN